MATPACSEEEFMGLWEEHRSAKKISKILNINERAVRR